MIKIVTVTGKKYYINNVKKHYFNGIIDNIELDGLCTIIVNTDNIKNQKVLMVSSIEYMEYIEEKEEWL